jgi:hypothetical protein
VRKANFMSGIIGCEINDVKTFAGQLLVEKGSEFN